jgi:hypothetical protein
MAARRLVMVMLVLLGLSTLAAAFVPPPSSRNGTTTQEAQRRPPVRKEQAPPTGGRLVDARVAVTNGKPRTIRLRPGDELRLSVGGGFGDLVQIPAFGLTETMSPYSPASFDLIPDREGRFAVRAVDANRVAAWILVSEQPPGCAAARPRARPERQRPPGCGRRGGSSGSAAGRSAPRSSDAEGPPRQ